MECGEVLEQFTNDDLGMCIIILSTFVYRQPSLAAPLLPRMLKTVARWDDVQPDLDNTIISSVLFNF